jgi:hypothetical protein
MSKEYPFTDDSGRTIFGREFDPEAPHPLTTTVGQCAGCEGVFTMTTEWKWVENSGQLPDIVIGLWQEESREVNPYDGPIEELERFFTTIKCPSCGGDLDGGNFET